MTRNATRSLTWTPAGSRATSRGSRSVTVPVPPGAHSEISEELLRIKPHTHVLNAEDPSRVDDRRQEGVVTSPR